MERLYIDCEFNGFGGELISMALVPDNGDLSEFYMEIELPCHPTQLVPWVYDNVYKKLDSTPVSYEWFQLALQHYLIAEIKQPVEIVADWPDDIKYFCQALITGPGEMISYNFPITFKVDRQLGSENSAVPHHALHDAIAIRNGNSTDS